MEIRNKLGCKNEPLALENKVLLFGSGFAVESGNRFLTDTLSLSPNQQKQ